MSVNRKKKRTGNFAGKSKDKAHEKQVSSVPPTTPPPPPEIKLPEMQGEPKKEKLNLAHKLTILSLIIALPVASITIYKACTDRPKFASRALHEQEQLLHDIISLHEEEAVHVNWEDIKNEPAPTTPAYSAKLEEDAKIKLHDFKPSWFDKIVGYKRKVKRLELNIPKAASKDQKRHADAILEYDLQFKTWQKLQLISEGIISHEPVSYKEAMDYFQLFTDTEGIGSGLSFLLNKENATIDLHVFDIDVIPKYIFSKTASGKLSRKNMPQSKLNKLYQEHVCSAILRVARDVLALLPLNGLVINATSKRLNAATGKIENQVLLSVLFYPNVLDELNFGAIDPSAAMQNFLHKMKFTQAGGFGAVEKIDVESVRQPGKG